MKDKRLPMPPYNPGLKGLVDAKREFSSSISPELQRAGFAGWHEGGYLPHRDEPGLVQFVTFNLADAFPVALRAEWQALLQIEENSERRKKLEAYLDKGHGECHLRKPAVAEMVENAFRFFHQKRYELRSWVVMPNHVHVLFRIETVPLAEILESWKSYTAKQANKSCGRTGSFWQPGYWDTYMRDPQHEARTRRYIENNPINARLVSDPKNWPYTSARFRDQNEMLVLPPRSKPET